GQQYRATALQCLAVEMLVRAHERESLQRALPVPTAALHIKEGVNRPGQRRIERCGTLGELLGREQRIFVTRLQEQAAQAEELGILVIGEAFKNPPRCTTIAAQLG